MPPRRAKRQRAASTPAVDGAPGLDTSLSSQHSTDDLDECCICITAPVLPIKLPCGHKFCYLCAKGSAAQNHLCPLCRAKVPESFFTRPKLLIGKRTQSTEIATSSDAAASSSVVGCDLSTLSVNEKNTQVGNNTAANDAPTASSVYPAWQYEGRGGGWWLYEERHRSPIEEAYAQKLTSIELLIAGFMYIINFADMKQFRKDMVHVVRNVRRIEQPPPTAVTVDGSGDATNTAHTSKANDSLQPLQDASVKGVAGVSKRLLLPNDATVPVSSTALSSGILASNIPVRKGRKRKN